MFWSQLAALRFKRISIDTLLLCALACFLILPSASSGAEDQSHKDIDSIVEQQSHALVAMAKRYIRALGPEKSQLLEQISTVAQHRKAMLMQQIDENPGLLLRVAIPSHLRQKMPVEVQEVLEQKLELEGNLIVAYEDHEDTPRLIYHLETGNDRLAIYFKEKEPKILSHTPVQLTGISLGGVMAVESGDSSLITLAIDGETTETNQQSADTSTYLPNTFGEQRTVVLLANYQDDPTDQPYSVTEAHELVFGTVSNFFLENSFGQTWLQGDVFGWYTLPMNRPTDPANCSASDIGQAAQHAAEDAGVDLSLYDRYIYVLAHTPCMTAGLGTVGGLPSESWINGPWFTSKTVAHELGHNLGLYHSAALECGNVTLAADCKTFPYGDIMDVMGNQSVGHFNSFQKERLGWLDPSLGHILAVENDGTYTLQAYEKAGELAPKSLKVITGIDAGTGEKNWFYLEHRQAIGFDAFLDGNENVLNGVVFHRATDADPASSQLLDLTPTDSSYEDWQSPALVSGTSFSDAESGVSVSTDWTDADGARVTVNFSAAPCVTTNPEITLSPSESQWVPAGTLVNYTVEVINNDTSACPVSNFDLSAGIPADWTATFINPTLSIEPGATSTTTLEITSAASTTDGFYTITAIARNAGNPAYVGTATTSYIVSNSITNSAPVAVDDNARTKRGVSVNVDVLSNDFDSDNDTLTVIEYTQGFKGSVDLDTQGVIVYTPAPNSNGDDHFTYTITDGLESAIASVSVSIKGNGGSKEGGGNGKGKQK